MTLTAVPDIATAHTWISVAAVLAGFISLLWHREISPRSAWGRIYILATFISCVTAFFIYKQGGFGVPHILAIVTLVFLRIGTAASEGRLGRASPYLEAFAFSATYFFHMIPGIVETSTRLPAGAPLVADRGSPVLLAAIGVCFALFLIGFTFQVIRLRRRSKSESRTFTGTAALQPTTSA